MLDDEESPMQPLNLASVMAEARSRESKKNDKAHATLLASHAEQSTKLVDYLTQIKTLTERASTAEATAAQRTLEVATLKQEVDRLKVQLGDLPKLRADLEKEIALRAGFEATCKVQKEQIDEHARNANFAMASFMNQVGANAGGVKAFQDILSANDRNRNA